jgi:hypothetical protein
MVEDLQNAGSTTPALLVQAYDTIIYIYDDLCVFGHSSMVFLTLYHLNILKVLNGRLCPIKELYNEFAVKLGLDEYALAILHIRYFFD